MLIEKLKSDTFGAAPEKDTVVYVSNAGYFAAYFGPEYVNILSYLNTKMFCKTLLNDIQNGVSSFKKDVELRETVCVGKTESIAIFLVRASRKVDGQYIVELVFETTAS